MTKRQHDTRVALRRAIHVHGDKGYETRLAAIEFCYAHNIDPHWRYAVYPKLTDPQPDWDKPVSLEVSAVSEWERVLARFTKDDA